MRRKILFLFLGVCLLFFITDLHAMECQIVDGEGNAIYSADAGALVYFKSTYAYSKSKKMAWNLMVTLPSVDLKNYKTSMKHNGYFFHGGSVENKSRLIPIVIPNDTFIEGNATFKYTLTSNKPCYVYLSISQDSEPPSTATLTATAVSTSRIDLSWTACTDNKGVAGYKIHNSNGTNLRTVNGTSTYFDNLNPSTQYCYTVTAHDGAGNESTHSNQACATTLSEQQDTTAPSIPTLTATAASSSRIDLSWTASTDNVGVAGYKIYNGSGTYLGAGNGTSTQFTGLNPNTQYCYKVTAYDAVGNESGYSNTACATTLSVQDTTAPSVPTLTATAASSSQINLSWTVSTDNMGVTGYKVYSGSGSSLRNVTGTSTSFTGLNPNTQYCYKVTAYDAANNESGYSNQACATTLPSQSTGKTWNMTADYSYGDDVLNISITSNPTNRTFYISFTGVSGDPFTCYGWTFVQESNQFNVSKSSYDADTALLTPNDGWSACSNIYPGVTKSGVIGQIPSWFNFNAPFTFVFDSQNSFLLSP